MRGKILIVDDEAAIRRMVCLALEQAGYDCIEAADTREAQERIVAGKPDLILLDWMLPGLSGADYARRLRQEKLSATIPVVPIEADGLTLDPVTHRVAATGHHLELGPTEFRLLHFFMTHAERVHSRERLLNGVWGENVYVEERTVDVHIRRLRKALAASGHDRLIQTVRGAGYRFSVQG
jgi:two-component system phosphate regulon response regulator PhoB